MPSRSERKADKQYQQSALYNLLNPRVREFNDSFSGRFVNFLDNKKMPGAKDWIKSGIKSGIMGNPLSLLGTGLRAGLSGVGNSMGGNYYDPSKGEIWQNKADVPQSGFMKLLDAMYAQQNPQQSSFDPLSPVQVTGQRIPEMGMRLPATTAGAPGPGSSTTQPYEDPLSPVQVTGQRIPTNEDLLEALDEVTVTGQRREMPGKEGGRNAADIGSMRTGKTFGARADGIGAWQDFNQRWDSLRPYMSWKIYGSGDSRRRAV